MIENLNLDDEMKLIKDKGLQHLGSVLAKVEIKINDIIEVFNRLQKP